MLQCQKETQLTKSFNGIFIGLLSQLFYAFFLGFLLRWHYLNKSEVLILHFLLLWRTKMNMIVKRNPSQPMFLLVPQMQLLEFALYYTMPFWAYVHVETYSSSKRCGWIIKTISIKSSFLKEFFFRNVNSLENPFVLHSHMLPLVHFFYSDLV